jgi:hypothetical protein
VQLVLNYEVRRWERHCEARTLARLRSTVEPCAVVPLRTTQESSGLSDPWERCKFIDRRNQKGWKTMVDRLVYSDYRESSSRKVALKIQTDDSQLGRMIVVCATFVIEQRE